MTIDDLIAELEKTGQGCGLISDDMGHWAVASFGMQTLPSNPPSDVCTSFIVEAHEWKPTIREALEAYHQSQIKFHKSRKSRPRKRRKRQ